MFKRVKLQLQSKIILANTPTAHRSLQKKLVQKRLRSQQREYAITRNTLSPLTRTHHAQPRDARVVHSAVQAAHPAHVGVIFVESRMMVYESVQQLCACVAAWGVNFTTTTKIKSGLSTMQPPPHQTVNSFCAHTTKPHFRIRELMPTYPRYTGLGSHDFHLRSSGTIHMNEQPITANTQHSCDNI